MTDSNYMPDVMVEIAFDSDYSTPAADRTWTDVSAYLELKDRISITRGRTEYGSEVEPSKLTLTLDNTDGRFTAGNTSGANYPDVKIGRPIRVKAKRVGASDYSTRFLGFVDEWPVGWEGGDSYAKATITASSRMARLGLGGELSNAYIEACRAATGLLAYYPLGDMAGSTSAVPMTGDDGALTPIGNGVDPTFGGEHAPTGTTAVEITGGRYLQGPIVAATSTVIVLEAVIATTDSGLRRVVSAHDSTDGTSFGIGLDIDGGKISAFVGDSSGGGNSGDSTTSIDTADLVHVAAVYDSSTAAITVYVDGIAEATDTASPAPTITDLAVLRVGGSPEYTTISSSVSHVVLSSDVDGLAERAEFMVETTRTASEWIGLFAEWAGIPSTELDLDSGTHDVEQFDTTGLTALAAMRVAETTEGGVLFDSRDGLLTFTSRDSRYNQDAAFTLDASLQQVESDIAPRLDRSGLVNDATATAADGSEQRVFDQDSIDEYGYAKSSVEISSTADDAMQAAGWMVWLGSDPRPRIPALTVDLLPLSATMQDDLLSADTGTKFTVSGLPSQAPASSMSFFVEGYTETIDLESYSLSLNVSSSDGFDVFTLDDATLGVLDGPYPLAW